MRARDLGIRIGDLEPGPLNAITDVPGTRVGHTTLIEGAAVRTGVTAVLPTPDGSPCFAGAHRLNGNGELTGLEWVRESGLLTTPVAITNTFSVGVVRDAIVAWQHERGLGAWHLPVVGETYDGRLNEIEGMHVTREHVFSALDAASGGAVDEGCVGGGTGMICHGFKGGIGTSSRRTGLGTVGVLVQANHGRRARFAVNGVPVGRLVDTPLPGESAADAARDGSIIVLVATDATLLPHQCGRLAQRAALGIARLGGAGENSSGDLILAWSTGNRIDAGAPAHDVRMVANSLLDELFYATIEATEEAILNALLAAKTMTGRVGFTAHALDPATLGRLLSEHAPLGQVPSPNVVSKL
ncbi:MAG TPA: P1 family peptidase [Gaiellaceae bacterium]|nr:P1 family peptidase [Gaiellaceae bacterium]